MPYSSQHKAEVRARIIETARVLFNRHGFEAVSIDTVMEHAGLTRGGFYNHFKNKASLYDEAVLSFLMGRGTQWRNEAGVNVKNHTIQDAKLMIKSYLSDEHLKDADGQCPMIALPSDVARSTPETHAAFEKLLSAMVGLFEFSVSDQSRSQESSRQKALSLAALCVGGMVLARAIPNSKLANEVRDAARQSVETILMS